MIVLPFILQTFINELLVWFYYEKNPDTLKFSMYIEIRSSNSMNKKS